MGGDEPMSIPDVDHNTHYLALVEIRELKARVKQLEAALREIADSEPRTGPRLMRETARAALGENQQ
jgi:hypothetical protein